MSRPPAADGSALPARLLREWRRTEYRAGGAVCRIGRHSPGMDAVLGGLGLGAGTAGRGVFVTAWNPLGRRMPEGWSRRMQARLAERLRRLPFLRGRGQGRGWGEDMILVAADPRRVARLGRVFRQLGVAEAAVGRPARLRVLRVPPMAGRG